MSESYPSAGSQSGSASGGPSSGSYGEQPPTSVGQPLYQQPGQGQPGQGQPGQGQQAQGQHGQGQPGGYGAPGGFATPGGYGSAAPGASYGGYGAPGTPTAPASPYGTGAPQGYGGYGASPYGPSGGTPRANPLADAGTVATLLTIVGYALAGLSVLAFILILVTDFGYGGSGVYKFAQALLALITGFGFGALSLGLGTIIKQRSTS